MGPSEHSSLLVCAWDPVESLTVSPNYQMSSNVGYLNEWTWKTWCIWFASSLLGHHKTATSAVDRFHVHVSGVEVLCLGPPPWEPPQQRASGAREEWENRVSTSLSFALNCVRSSETQKPSLSRGRRSQGRAPLKVSMGRQRREQKVGWSGWIWEEIRGFLNLQSVELSGL